MARQKQNGVEQFKVDHELSMVQRTAQFLDWAAQNHPGRFFSYPEVTRAIMGYAKTPRLGSEEVQQLRRSISANVRNTLITKYNRETISVPGVGVRASVDDADRLENVAPKKAKRLSAARRSFMVTADAINLRNVPDTAVYAALKSWMGREVRDVMKAIGSPEFERKLLPPSTATPAESEK